MRKILFALSCGYIISIIGCKEIGPPINLTPGGGTVTSGFADSTYMLTATQIAALTTDSHNVLVEEFTGQTCANCPAAHSALNAIVAQHADGNVNVIGLFPPGIPQANPPAGYVYDLRDSSAFLIGNSVYNGIIGLPGGGVDRIPGPNGSIEQSRTFWANNITARLGIADSVNLQLKSSYNTTTGVAKIVAAVTYTQALSGKQNLSVVVVEDGIVDLQEFPDSVHSNYPFNDVCRGMVSSAPFGDPILDTLATKAKGRVLQRTYSYKLKTVTPAIKPANCRVIAFINSTSPNGQILQSAQTKLAP
jgi:hypothetical protein